MRRGAGFVAVSGMVFGIGDASQAIPLSDSWFDVEAAEEALRGAGMYRDSRTY